MQHLSVIPLFDAFPLLLRNSQTPIWIIDHLIPQKNVQQSWTEMKSIVKTIHPLRSTWPAIVEAGSLQRGCMCVSVRKVEGSAFGMAGDAYVNFLFFCPSYTCGDPPFMQS